MKDLKRITSMATAAVITLGAGSAVVPQMQASAKYGTGSNIVEYLDRGITAVNTGSGMLVSWRFLANDADNTVFKLYRNGTLIYTSQASDATCYLDKGGSASSQYRVETLVNDQVVSADDCMFTTNNSYFNIPMDVPKGGTTPDGVAYTYSPNDCSTGDVDGDGVYEIFVKWDPSNSKDNSHSGYTGNVFIDCYRLNGEKLWRVDLGRNIRAGAHYTQFLVADFDCDGKAEMTCKTADGTVDGVGKVIGDASKDYRNAGGYILSGPEYYTLFDGTTGAALDTVNYEFPRGDVSKWGDGYGNRCDRFLGAVMYCDGVKPSAVSVRGYYTRMTVVAYDVVDKKLVKRWSYDTGNNYAAAGYGNGNHNGMPADVDGDGKQELVLGATCIDDDGSVLWCNRLGHGDAMHLGDFLPDRPGQELWVAHEHAPYGVSLLDAKNGSTIFHYDHSKDTGRAAAGNIYAGNPGAEFWGAQSGTVYNGTGGSTGIARPAMNFLIYWDGDLERELMDGTAISNINSSKQVEYLLMANDCGSCNSTKATPCLTADLYGDWREELVLRTNDNKYLRVYCTPYTTNVRLTTLMHDTTYRMQVSAEQSGYNQPPHTGFYLGSDKPLPDRPAVTINGEGIEPPVISGVLFDSLLVNDYTNRSNWSIQENLNVGSKIFGDRDFTYTSVPDALVGAEYIQPACDSKTYANQLGKVNITKDAVVYVALDTRLNPIPDWMNEWTVTDMTLTTSNDVTMQVYAKVVKSGETVTLGSNTTGYNVINYVTFAMEGTEIPKETTTTTTTTTTTAPHTPTLLGDVNCDGNVKIDDVILLNRVLAEDTTAQVSAQGLANGECDGIANLAAGDATAILSLLAGIVSSLPLQ